MNTGSKGTLLLDALDALVRADVGPPGFLGTVAIGVQTPMGPRWWVVDCSAKATPSFHDGVPETASVALLLDEAGAAGILASGDPGDEVSMLGDAKVLERFLERYLKKRSFLSVRVSQQSHSSASPKKARANGRAR